MRDDRTGLDYEAEAGECCYFCGVELRDGDLVYRMVDDDDTVWFSHKECDDRDSEASLREASRPPQG